MTTAFRSLRWLLAALELIAARLWPALWNGFPIVFYDTGGYLDASGLRHPGEWPLHALRDVPAVRHPHQLLVQYYRASGGGRLVDRWDLARARPRRPVLAAQSPHFRRSGAQTSAAAQEA
jgi:hypothetical protein